MEASHIPKENWVEYLTELYRAEDTKAVLSTHEIVTNGDIEIEMSDIQLALKKLKTIKSAGQDEIANELLKYGKQSLLQQLKILTRKILNQNRITDEWRTSTIILIFKKGDKKTQQSIEE